MFLTHNDETIQYSIKYSNRKSVEIKLLPSCEVVLKGPKMPNQAYEDILMKRWAWIQEHLLQMQTDHAGLKKRSYESGEPFVILEKTFTLKVVKHQNNRASIKRIENELLMYVPEDFHRLHYQEMLFEFMKPILKKCLEARIQQFQPFFNQKVNKVTVRDQKTRWGSCSSARNLSFNYRLIMAPLEVIDYIVVHEMCHLEHMNHSKSFWKKVYQVMPDYENHEQWLKRNGFKLSLEYRETL